MTREQANEVLKSLSARQRACIVLNRRDNLSVAQIAKLLDLGEREVTHAIASSLYAFTQATPAGGVLDVSELNRRISCYLAHPSGRPADHIAQEILREARAQDVMAGWHLPASLLSRTRRGLR